MMKRICLLAVFCILLCSCQGRNYETNAQATAEITRVPIIYPKITEYHPAQKVVKTPEATLTPTPTVPVIIPVETMPTAAAYNDPQLVMRIYGEEVWRGVISFSHNGQFIAQAYSGVKIWDIENRVLVFEKEFPYQGVATNVVFSPDDQYIAVNTSDFYYADGGADSHLLIWDTTTGELIQDIVQHEAIMSANHGYDPEPTIYQIPVNAMAFFPTENRLAFANGNNIEIIDLSGETESVRWTLGEEMYASALSIRDDGEMMYILMEWNKNHTFSFNYSWKYRVEIWRPNPNGFMKAIRFEEVYQREGTDKFLVDQYLIEEDRQANTLTAVNLTTDTYSEFPYRMGWKYFNEDASLMFVVRYIGVSTEYEGWEIWNTDTWRSSITFMPAVIDNMFGINDVAFHPNKNLVAVDYHGSIYVYDISFLNE